MKKKGFTLVELLAVVIILAIVALIATPIVTNIIKTSRRKANYQIAVNLVHSAENYYGEALVNPTVRNDVNNINNIYNVVETTGRKPAEGELYVNKKGMVALSVRIDEYCYVKDFYGELEETDDCELKGYRGVDEIKPTVTFDITGTKGNNDWYVSNASIKVTPYDAESGISHYLWCTGENCIPSNKETSTKELAIDDTLVGQVCVIAYDKADNASNKICSSAVKVDTVKPEATGIGDMVVSRNAAVDLGIITTDATSGIASATYEPSTIDTTKTGVYNVAYTITDNAGNTRNLTRKVTIEASAPTIAYTPEANAINANGWAKNDFYVTLDVTDNSGHGIKEFKVCTATEDTCDPDTGTTVTGETQATRLINTENNNNRICIKAIDNTNQESEVICSDAFKLDKTNPTAGKAKFNGSSTLKDWYNEDVTIVPQNGSDALSGHATTTVDVSSITENTSGTVVKVTTRDNAGNSKTRKYTVKVDKTQPTASIAKSVSDNKNVFTVTAVPDTTISGYNYQWYKDGVAIEEATSATYEAAEAGTFKVVVTTGAGKEVTSNEITINSYTITYDVNGGTGTITDTTKIQDLSVNITSTEPTKSGFTFAGWSTTQNSKTVNYAKGTAYTANSGTTLYAVWKKTVIVSYSANGGAGTMTSDTCDIYNDETQCSITVKANGFTNSGKTFQGWGTSTTVTHNAGTAYNFSANTTLNAIWKANYTCATGTLTADATRGKNSGGYICKKQNATQKSSTDWDCSGEIRETEGCTCVTSSNQSYCTSHTGSYSTYSIGGGLCACAADPSYTVSCAPYTSTGCADSDYSYSNGQCCKKETSYYYACPSGWSTYSGSGSSMWCYTAATLGS